MMNLNNKGQSLVMFIIMIPLIIILLALVYDFGNIIYQKERLDNTAYMAISYGLNNIDSISENDIVSLIRKNSDDANYIDVKINDNIINIIIKKDVKTVFNNFNLDFDTIISEYRGEIIGSEKRIERMK